MCSNYVRKLVQSRAGFGIFPILRSHHLSRLSSGSQPTNSSSISTPRASMVLLIRAYTRARVLIVTRSLSSNCSATRA